VESASFSLLEKGKRGYIIWMLPLKREEDRREEESRSSSLPEKKIEERAAH